MVRSTHIQDMKARSRRRSRRLSKTGSSIVLDVCPPEIVTEIKDSKTKQVEKDIPGYVLVKMIMTDRLACCGTPAVSRVCRTGVETDSADRRGSFVAWRGKHEIKVSYGVGDSKITDGRLRTL